MKKLFASLLKNTKSGHPRMSVQELISLFPEIPKDLHEEPILAQFADTFADLLRAARNPSACSTDHDAGHQYYLKLIGPLKIYMYGLSSREKVLKQLRELLDRHATDPDGFPASLISEPSEQAR